jgi:nucleotide-binding universal stress UspA family protein
MSQPMEQVSTAGDVAGSVVVAVDGSDHSDRAVRWAAEQAVLERRRLVAVAVGRDTGTAAEDAVAAARELAPDLAVRGASVTGDPREVLIDLSADAHLLVVGSRGRGSLRGILLGSVSAAVSAQSACPVVVCRPSGDDPVQPGVLVGADGTRESRAVIEFAYRQASLRDLPLTVLHCFWDAAAAVAQYREARGQSVVPPDLEELRAALSEAVAGLAEQYPDVPVTLTLKHGFADQALGPRHGGWDLVVVGRHPMTSLGRVLTGSIATTVVERAHGPVAVVPEAAPPA